MKITLQGYQFTYAEVCKTPEGIYLMRVDTKDRYQEVDYYDGNDTKVITYDFLIEGNFTSRVTIQTSTPEEFRYFNNVMSFKRTTKNEHLFLFYSYNAFLKREFVAGTK